MRSNKRSDLLKNRWFWLVAALFSALVGMWILLVSMKQGPGVGGDATIYISSARNLITGKGLGLYNPDGDFRLIPYFPPFYPLVLALGGLLGFGIVSFASFINIFCFGLTIFLLSHSLSTLLKNGVIGLLLGLLLAGSPIMVPAYSWAMSEPLCFLLMIGGFLLLVRWFENGSRAMLLASALLCGLSFLTRYSSVACLLTACFLLLVVQKKPFRARFWDSFQYGLIAGIPMLLWLAYDLMKTQTVASRSLLEGNNLFWESARFIRQLIPIFAQWFFPDSWLQEGAFWSHLTAPVFIIICLFVIWNLVDAAKKLEQPIPPQKSVVDFARLVFSAFFFIYILVVWLVSVLTFPPITIGSRMLIPAYMSLFVLTGIAVSTFLHPDSWFRTGQIMLLLLLVIFTAFHGLRGTRIARQNAIDGLGFNSVRWKNSETLRYIQEQVPTDQLLVTNEETGMLFRINRVSWPVREIYANDPDQIFYSYLDGPVPADDKGRNAFLDGRALLVVFDTFEDQMRQIYHEETPTRIAALLDRLTTLFDGDDGTIYIRE